MKTLRYLIILFLILICGCFAQKEFSFDIDIGSEKSEVQIKKYPWGYSGPNAIRKYNNEIYILDQENYKVNVYSNQGNYIRTFYLQKGLYYWDIAIDNDGKVLLLTNKGIYSLTDYGQLINKYDTTALIKDPSFFSISKTGDIVLTGRDKSVFISKDGDFSELKGIRVFISNSGLIGLQVSDSKVNLLKDKKVIGHIDINVKPYMIPFGITDDKIIFCEVGSEKRGFIKIYKINQNGVLAVKEIKRESLISLEDVGIITSLRVNDKGEIIMLEGTKDNCKVSIISL